MAMQLTRAGEYAVRSLVYLATLNSDARVMASEVATAENIPVNFVRKILESLAKAGLVKSYRGAGGGFTLGREPEQITLRQIIEAVEGPFALNECLAPAGCERMHLCPVTHVWGEVQSAVEEILDHHNLEEIARANLLQRTTPAPVN
jgi:Rrf2 family protein